MTLLGRVRAAVDAFRDYGHTLHLSDQDIYQLLWAWYAGKWHASVQGAAERAYSPQLYRNARQVWRQDNAVVSFYGQYVYQGDLSMDGKPLPDGTRGAIPIDPQTGETTKDEALLKAIAAVWAMTNWRQHMSTRPRMGAILGSGLTELVDDLEHGLVMPQWVWPGYVPEQDLELDSRGHVKRYAVEYDVVIPESTAFGRPQKADRYRFRKEVDGEKFRFYRDDKPSAFPDMGINEPEHPNPYGFVPAIWDQHEPVPFSKRGLSALEKQLGQILEVNSILSHALDHNRKIFATPVGIIGRATKRGARMVLPTGAIETPDTQEKRELQRAIDAQAAAENINLIDLDDGGGFAVPQFNASATKELLSLVLESLASERPEAQYGQELLKMSQVTGPGVERVLAPIIGLINSAREQYDPNTASMLRMEIAMVAYRLKQGDYPSELVTSRPDRYQPFEGFGLDSYGKGDLDFTIPRRDVFPESREEKVNRLILIESLTTEWAQIEAGMPEAEVRKLAAKRDQERREMASAFSVAGAGSEEEDDQGQSRGETQA